jgi:antibiotic biosynthesis monooxygenase (ABM) superfamily enzyme
MFPISLAANEGYIEIHPFLMGVILVCILSAQFFVILDDRLNKYWLYDEKRKAYYG